MLAQKFTHSDSGRLQLCYIVAALYYFAHPLRLRKTAALLHCCRFVLLCSPTQTQEDCSFVTLLPLCITLLTHSDSGRLQLCYIVAALYYFAHPLRLRKTAALLHCCRFVLLCSPTQTQEDCSFATLLPLCITLLTHSDSGRLQLCYIVAALYYFAHPLRLRKTAALLHCCRFVLLCSPTQTQEDCSFATLLPLCITLLTHSDSGRLQLCYIVAALYYFAHPLRLRKTAALLHCCRFVLLCSPTQTQEDCSFATLLPLCITLLTHSDSGRLQLCYIVAALYYFAHPLRLRKTAALLHCCRFVLLCSPTQTQEDCSFATLLPLCITLLTHSDSGRLQLCYIVAALYYFAHPLRLRKTAALLHCCRFVLLCSPTQTQEDCSFVTLLPLCITLLTHSDSGRLQLCYIVAALYYFAHPLRLRKTAALLHCCRFVLLCSPTQTQEDCSFATLLPLCITLLTHSDSGRLQLCYIVAALYYFAHPLRLRKTAALLHCCRFVLLCSPTQTQEDCSFATLLPLCITLLTHSDSGRLQLCYIVAALYYFAHPLRLRKTAALLHCCRFVLLCSPTQTQEDCSFATLLPLCITLLTHSDSGRLQLCYIVAALYYFAHPLRLRKTAALLHCCRFVLLCSPTQTQEDCSFVTLLPLCITLLTHSDSGRLQLCYIVAALYYFAHPLRLRKTAALLHCCRFVLLFVIAVNLYPKEL